MRGEIKVSHWTGCGFITAMEVGVGGTATTTWNYDPYRGWLSSKDYPNSSTGAAGTLGPDYTYTAGGRLKTRTWARGTVTTYKYGFDDSVSANQHGQLTLVDYGDTTPDVTYTYDRRGRRAQAVQDTDAGGSNDLTANFDYNEADELISESWSNGTLNTWNVNPVYDTKLRRSQLLVKLGATLKIQHDYSYDNASRLQKVWQGLYSANYTYEPNSSLIDKVEYQYSSTATELTGDRAYDKLNRLTAMANTPQSGVTMNYSYQYNDANQRIRTVLADGSYWVYQYDDPGQVISGRRFWADHTPVAGQQFEYVFDDIGNRTSAKSGGNSSGTGLRTENYTRNRLNQYSQKDEAATFDVVGLANVSASVTVNGSSAYRKGEYFQKELTVSNGSVPVWQSVSTIASLGGSSVTNTGNMYIAKTPEVYAHDLDGNLTSDGHWSYTWDAENRLTMQQTIGTAPTGAKKQLVFEYDWMGRRIRKQVYDWISSAWSLVQDERFIYDGWNVIAVLDSATTIKKTLLWGLDLSGSMQGAGGVGGLLALTDYPSSKTYFTGYDGNGNVTVLIDGVSGLTEGNFEYGPFGELIRASGNAASVCPWRFSTKYEDAETGMLYYGFRYYNPSTGRWLSRDPIEERGGNNLFRIAHNEIQGDWDFLGLVGGCQIYNENAHVSVVCDIPDGDPQVFKNSYGTVPFFVGLIQFHDGAQCVTMKIIHFFELFIQNAVQTYTHVEVDVAAAIPSEVSEAGLVTDIAGLVPGGVGIGAGVADLGLDAFPDLIDMYPNAVIGKSRRELWSKAWYTYAGIEQTVTDRRTVPCTYCETKWLAGPFPDPQKIGSTPVINQYE